ncbi:MAG: DNA-formamidopyrimidine glycosylase [Cyanobacteria bacterium J069]|nr:MAG: DNA-formamidopyrimidine glycosylase [Cyanobacteria bacterium J069]
MPELPEVETVRRGLNLTTLSQPIVGGDVLLERTIAYPSFTTDFLDGLRGRAIAQWQRRGKYLLAELVDATHQPAGYLGVHLRMTGQLRWLSQDDPLQKHCRVRLFFPENRELRFVDQRTFGQMWWVPSDRPPASIMTGLQALGPEPLSDDFSVDYFAKWLRDRQRPIKNALLDQSLVAGIGNIYADEALFLSGIRPQTLCARLKSRQIQRLYEAIRDVLQTAIAANGTTFSDFRDVQGTNGNYGGVAWVYNRDGEPCRVCSAPILRLKMAGRSAHYCQACQR